MQNSSPRNLWPNGVERAQRVLSSSTPHISTTNQGLPVFSPARIRTPTPPPWAAEGGSSTTDMEIEVDTTPRNGLAERHQKTDRQPSTTVPPPPRRPRRRHKPRKRRTQHPHTETPADKEEAKRRQDRAYRVQKPRERLAPGFNPDALADRRSILSAQDGQLDERALARIQGRAPRTSDAERGTQSGALGSGGRGGEGGGSVGEEDNMAVDEGPCGGEPRGAQGPDVNDRGGEGADGESMVVDTDGGDGAAADKDADVLMG